MTPFFLSLTARLAITGVAVAAAAALVGTFSWIGEREASTRYLPSKTAPTPERKR